MKAIKNALPIAELRKTIGQWKSCKITDATIAKLLDLYLGIPAYMADDGTYPVENFHDLSLSLRFRNTRYLVEAVRQCRSFGIVEGDNCYHMKSFYSPLWRTAKPDDGNLADVQSKMQTDNIYNNISKEDAAGEAISPAGDNVPENPSSKKNIITPESLLAAKEFFHRINEDAAQKSQILVPLIDRFQRQEGLTRGHACENLVYMVNELLVPYFAMQPHFMKSNHVGRLAWLNNLLKSAHGGHLINDAAKAGRVKREQAALEDNLAARNNHPLSDFEWTDLESSMRFYDDDIEGRVHIPDDAPPRPSAQAVWNVLSRGWNTPLNSSLT